MPQILHLTRIQPVITEIVILQALKLAWQLFILNGPPCARHFFFKQFFFSRGGSLESTLYTKPVAMNSLYTYVNKVLMTNNLGEVMVAHLYG